MTPAAWLTSADPAALLAFAAPRLSDRQLRLYLVGCCRRRWELFDDPRPRQAVAIAERFADGLAKEVELRHGMAIALEAAEQAFWTRDRSGLPEAQNQAAQAAQMTCDAPADLRRTADGPSADVPRLLAASHARRTAETAHRPRVRAGELAAAADLLRCVAGDPFAYEVLDPKWQTDTVQSLAAGIYADRAFDRLPILADALEDAGCDAADVLRHCRADTDHCRGCWVIDRLLGRT